MRKLAVIVARVLARSENIYHFRRPQRHHRPENDAVNERENCRINSDRERERQYRDSSESRRFHELPDSKFEILNHDRWKRLRCVSSEMPFALGLDS